MAGAVIDRIEVWINAADHSDDVEPLTVDHPPDGMSRTATLAAPEADHPSEAASDYHVGARALILCRREGLPSGDDIINIFDGMVVDKIDPEAGGLSTLTLNLVDHIYRLERNYVRFSVTSQTVSKDLHLHFKDANDGSGAPQQYVKRAEFRVKDGADFYIPFEDMDTIPLHSLRRKKDDTPSVYINQNEYKIAYLRKEILFTAAQIDGDSGLALPNTYVTGTPDPPLNTNEDWEYKAVASFFRNPDFPTRNTDQNTAENLLRNQVFGGDPLSDAGGAGFPSSMLNLTYTYAKGGAVVIPDRANEGMRVSAVSGSDVTVSDGDAWAGKTDLSYYDTQGVYRTYTISGIVGDVITLTAPPEKIVEGVRAYGCDQLGIIVTLTGVGDETWEMVNYTDIVIAGTSYHIREIRDDTTLVIVNTDETDDFSGLAASGSLIYPTIEYTGLQIKRLNWDKDEGPCSDVVDFFYEKNLLPFNYRIWFDPRVGVVRGRLIRQYRGVVVSVTATEIELDNVDGFYPGETICWQDTDGEWHQVVIASVDYATETLTMAAFNPAAVGMVADDIVYGNCRIIYRHVGGEHAVTLETLFYRTEVLSTANGAFPLLNQNLTATPSAAPTVPGGEAGTWTFPSGNTAAAECDLIVDDTPTTMYLLRWQATASGQLDGDAEQYGMTPIPWPVCAWDYGEEKTVHQLLLQIGYTEDDKPSVELVHEMPLFTAEGSMDGISFSAVSSKLVAAQFDPLNPNNGTLVFDCDLLTRFRHIRLMVDRPFFYKQKENIFGTPTRCRDVPILTFQAYERPLIRYEELDEEMSQDALSPVGQISPDHIGERPFAQLTNKGGVITNIVILANSVLTVGANHNFIIGDKVAYWDSVNGVPYTATGEVVGTAATTITVDAIPGPLANGDLVGDIRRWLLDVTGEWRDLLAKTLVARTFALVKPMQPVEDESPQNAWDGQQIAVLRQYEAMISARDGKTSALFDPHIQLYMQVVGSNIYAPEMVMGINMSGYEFHYQLRQFNVTAEEVAAGG